MGHNAMLNRLIPAGTKRHLWYSRFLGAAEILFNEGWGSLWFQIKHALRQPFLSCDKIDEITQEELRDNRTRLMIVIPTMGMGGAERCAAVLLEHLDRTRIRPELVTIFDRDLFYQFPGDVKLHVLEKLSPVKTPKPLPSLPDHLRRHAHGLALLEVAALKLSDVIAKRQPSVILAQDYFASFIALLAKKHIPPSIKLIVSGHNSPSGLFSTDKYGELYAYFVRTLFNDADNVIAVSKGVVQELTATFELRPEKIMALHNPIDLIQIRTGADEGVSEHAWFNEDIPVILFAGRLASYKGLDYLLKACSIANKSKRLRCVLIGEGEEKAHLTQLAEESGIAKDVVFIGRQRNPFKFMRRAAIFVLPSLTEGLPYVLVEALACGCPVIATDSPGGGPAEILKNGEYGLLIPPGDEKALSGAIMRLLTDDGLRNRFSRRAVERAKDFDLGNTVKAYEDIILKT